MIQTVPIVMLRRAENEMKDDEKKTVELESVNIETLYLKDGGVVYEVPIYQRNFAWGKDEIETLIQDVYDACKEGKKEGKNYYIGTLVTFHKKTGEYEVIDGQQRLTAVRLILSALGEKRLNILRYKSRDDSFRALEAIDKNVDQNSGSVENLRELRNKDLLSNEMDQVIIDGFRNAVDSLLKVVGTDEELKQFKCYFKKYVHIIRYQVPEDTDLNQYFEVMNSRGEQLEQHEIVKANLMKHLDDQNEKEVFAAIWEVCSKMDCYVQQSIKPYIKYKNWIEKIYGENLDEFIIKENNNKSKMIWELIKNSIPKQRRLAIKEDSNTWTISGEKEGQEGKKLEEPKDVELDCLSFLTLLFKASQLLDSGHFKEKNEECEIAKVSQDGGVKCMSKSVGAKTSLKELCGLSETKMMEDEGEDKEHFQQIIDFPNFLLIVLKITVMLKKWKPLKADSEKKEEANKITLNDKNLKSHFDDYFPNGDDENKEEKKARVRTFTYNLLKAKFFLDNYMVHRSKEQREEEGKNPWQLQVWRKNDKGSADEKNNGAPYNLCKGTEGEIQEKLVQILSMFEVTYGSRQRKNYLFYCLFFLMDSNSESNDPDRKKSPLSEYLKFLEELAERYLHEFYLKGKSEFSGDFDDVILKDSGLNRELIKKNKNYDSEKFFNYDKMTPQEKPEESLAELRKIFGNGNIASSGISPFVFNYLDYKIWELYRSKFQTEKNEKQDEDFYKNFKSKFGCDLRGNENVLNLNVFKNFFFSRSRDSLEHYFPTANCETDSRDLDKTKINCLGNYAMIGRSANSSGSNWTPEEKVDHYLSPSKKIDRVSVSSLKFRIMLKMCKDKGKWDWEEIEEHQTKMLNILFGPVETNGSQKGNSEDNSKDN